MNRRIAMSAFSILSALALLGGGAFAAFTTTATATGNTFSTTNPNLFISTDGGVNFAQTEPGFTQGGIVPGGAGVVHNFKLQNTNTGPDDTMTLTGQINPTAGDPSLESSFQVRMTCSNGTDTGYVVMSTWMSTPPSLGTLAPGATIDCTMQVALPSGNTTDANKSITFDTQFNASLGN